METNSEGNYMLIVNRFFSKVEKHPFDECEWSTRRVELKGSDGQIIYFADVEFPINWSDQAALIVSSKYFKIPKGSTQREYSLKQLINRVANTITEWGVQYKYFDSENAENFNKELKWLLVNQRFAFNSPVWFNLGLPDVAPQGSACFILPIEDSIESFMKVQSETVKIFKSGSGVGLNFSALRGKGEPVSGGGKSSGTISFMRGFDAWGGSIKSGGANRRAASIFILDADHPDIEEFITCKVNEEKKARFLIENGWDGSMEGPVYSSLSMQNANLSVMVTDEFMKAAVENKPFNLRWRTSEKKIQIDASKLLDKISQATWDNGDPGLLFYEAMNKKNPFDRPINACNPCQEFNAPIGACNLASINLPLGGLDFKSYKQMIRTIVIAMDIVCEGSVYPTEEITEFTKKFRPLGIGVTNLGGHLMSNLIPYDSDEGRSISEEIYKVLTRKAIETSEEISKVLGSNFGGERRNAQLTLAAPSGTISFMLDAVTTGIEPDYSLIKYKSLIGGGTLRIVSPAIEIALNKIFTGDEAKIKNTINYIVDKETVEGSDVPKKFWAIFQCAKGVNRSSEISVDGHLGILKAVVQNMSGSASKTVNVPNETTVEEIKQIFIKAWKMGLKGIAIYRDGSKGVQPLKSTIKTLIPSPKAVKRYPLAPKREAEITKFNLGNHEGYLIVGKYPDGYPGEVFLQMSKAGSSVNGYSAALGVLVSMCLQHGVPIETIIDKLENMQFEPSGYTGNKDIPFANSSVDYIARELKRRYLTPNQVVKSEEKSKGDGNGSVCSNCGSSSLMKTGSCYTCSTCGQAGSCG